MVFAVTLWTKSDGTFTELLYILYVKRFKVGHVIHVALGLDPHLGTNASETVVPEKQGQPVHHDKVAMLEGA